jgi:hypothetical protein
MEPKGCDGEVTQEQHRPEPSLREGTEGKTLSEEQMWYAKLPSVCKRHIFSLLGHRGVAIAIQAES